MTESIKFTLTPTLEDVMQIAVTIGSGFLAAYCWLAYYFHYYTLRQKRLRHATGDTGDTSDTSTDASSETEGEAEGDEFQIAQYLEKYQDELQALLTGTNKKTLAGHFVDEETPRGRIVMLYDEAAQRFDYYADHLSQITYALLNTVARKFVIEHNCKNRYMTEAKADDADADANADANADADAYAVADAYVKETPSVFAKFKSYQKDKGVVKQANQFKHLGKLAEWQVQEQKEAQKQKEAAADAETWTYAKYKMFHVQQKQSDL